MKSNNAARTAKAKYMQGSVLCQCKVCGPNGTFMPRTTKESHKKSSFLRKQREIRTSRARMLLNSHRKPSKILAPRISARQEGHLQGEQDIKEASSNVANKTGSMSVSIDHSFVPSPSLMDLDSPIYPADYSGPRAPNLDESASASQPTGSRTVTQSPLTQTHTLSV